MATPFQHIDGLVQERRNSSSLAMELRLFALAHRYGLIISSGLDCCFWLKFKFHLKSWFSMGKLDLSGVLILSQKRHPNPDVTSQWEVYSMRESSINCIPWWRHQMETFSALLALCVGNSPVTGEFPTQRPVTRSFDVFFDLRMNKRLSKQWRGWWFETPSRSLCRQCNAKYTFNIIFYMYWDMYTLVWSV